MASTYVLLLVFFLSGGGTTTHSLIAPTWTECQETKPLIKNEYYRDGIILSKKKYKVENIVAVCMKVEEQENR